MRLLLTAIIFAGISGAASAEDAEKGMAWIDETSKHGGCTSVASDRAACVSPLARSTG